MRAALCFVVLTLLPVAGAAAPQDAAAGAATLPRAAFQTDEEVERFLKEAKVVRTRGTSKGVTDSTRATLSDGTVNHDAHIQTIDESKREFRTSTGVEFDFRDSWTFNVAAYKIDRLIGLNMVPVSVSRPYRSAPAAFTWWVDDVLMDEAERLKQKVDAPDRGTFSRQMSMMRLFDELIANTDRNMGNMVYTRDWRLWLIDHTRGFRKNTALRRPPNVVRCDKAVFEAIKKLDSITLKREVGRLLDDGQLRALLLRRDLIVQRIESLGPGALFDRTVPPGTAALPVVTPLVPAKQRSAGTPYILGTQVLELESSCPVMHVSSSPVWRSPLRSAQSCRWSTV